MIDGLYEKFEDSAKDDLEKCYSESNDSLEAKDQSRKRISILFKMIENIYVTLKNDSYVHKKNLDLISYNCENNRKSCAFLHSEGKSLEDKVLKVLEKQARYTMPFFKWTVSGALGLFFTFQLYELKVINQISVELEKHKTVVDMHAKGDEDKAKARQERLDRLERAVFRQEE